MNNNLTEYQQPALASQQEFYQKINAEFDQLASEAKEAMKELSKLDNNENK
jgi:hypothetical protein